MMTEHKLFNTKILLRNDDLSNWIESPLVLGKGEVALSWEDGNCKLKVGNGSSAWSGLDYLALDESQISSFLTELEGNVGDLTTRLDVAESEIDALSSNAKTYQLSADGQTVYLMEKSGDGDFNPTAVSFTIPTVPSTDPYSEENPLATKKYVDDAISAVEESVAEGLDDIRAELSSAWKVKGVLSVDDFPGDDFKAVPDELYADGEEPQDGDIVINKNIEYVWASGKWNELGNEGNYAVKGAIVNADIAENAAIAQTKIASSQGNDNLAEDIEKLVFNAYSFEVGATEISSLEDIIDANESTLSNANKGDIIVINSKNVSADFGRQSFVFAGTDPLSAPCWETLNEKYDASNVYFTKDLTYTVGLGTIAAPSGSGTLSVTGKSVEDLFSQILAKESTSIGIDQNWSTTFSASSTSLTGEIGTAITGTPTFTLAASDAPNWASYGGINEDGEKVGQSATGSMISGEILSGDTVLASGKDKTSAVTIATYTLPASSWTTSTFTVAGQSQTLRATSYATASTSKPVTNLGNLILNASVSNITQTGSYSEENYAAAKGGFAATSVTPDETTVTVTATGIYPAYYAFTTKPTSNPTAITATNGNVTVDGVTYTREINNSFAKTSFTTNSGWYELFYLVPVSKNNRTWTGKDSNNLTLAIDAKTTATVTFKDNTTTTYNVFVVRNAAKSDPTTCTMKFA